VIKTVRCSGDQARNRVRDNMHDFIYM